MFKAPQRFRFIFHATLIINNYYCVLNSCTTNYCSGTSPATAATWFAGQGHALEVSVDHELSSWPFRFSASSSAVSVPWPMPLSSRCSCILVESSATTWVALSPTSRWWIYARPSFTQPHLYSTWPRRTLCKFVNVWILIIVIIWISDICISDYLIVHCYVFK